jgi:hypothetical protein
VNTVPRTETTRGNGAGEPSSHSASSIVRRSRLRRTLLTAGVFALFAMIYVPTPRQGYRFIFSQEDTSIAFFQLLVNAAFAALLGAILAIIVAKMSKRARWVSGCILVVAVVVAVASFAGVKIVEGAWLRAQNEEAYAEVWFVPPYGANEVAKARERFRNAAFNWRLALQFERAASAEARANGAAEEMEATRKRAAEEAKRKEELERQLAQEREFDRQWKINAQRVIDAYPELRNENSLYSLAMKKVLNSNPVYSQRVDGFEQAYKIIVKQLPPPTGELMPTGEFYRLLERLKVDVTPPPISTNPDAGIDLWQWKEEEKLIHDPINYQRGKWTTGSGEAFVVAKFFERNLGDRKAELDALADKLGAQKRYTLIEKQKRDGVWWIRVFLYKR